MSLTTGSLPPIYNTT